MSLIWARAADGLKHLLDRGVEQVALQLGQMLLCTVDVHTKSSHRYEDMGSDAMHGKEAVVQSVCWRPIASRVNFPLPHPVKDGVCVEAFGV